MIVWVVLPGDWFEQIFVLVLGVDVVAAGVDADGGLVGVFAYFVFFVVV